MRKSGYSAVICLFILAGQMTAHANASTVPATFIFGDSLTDVGNNNHLTYCLAKSNFLWYGIDYKGGVPTGRFTNGKTISDIISEKLGLPVAKAYLGMSDEKDEGVLHGANYASGGAGILNETGFLFIEKVSFDQQIQHFEATKERIKKKVGAKAAENLLHQAIYFVLIGSNDYINNYLLPVPTQAQQYTPDGFEQLLLSSLKRQLTRIYEVGARKIVFNGMGPLGCIPSQRVQNPKGGGGCLDNVNGWAIKFNVKMKKLLRDLNSQLRGVNITYVDTYGLVMQVIQNADKYGFEVSDAPCCNVDTTFGQFCLPNSKLCQDRSKYVFWDAFHPTEAANEVMANIILSDPSILPYTPKNSTPKGSPAPAPAPAPQR